MFKSILVFCFLCFAFLVNCNAQTCGFGCFGLSGFYGGYTYQKYNAEGLNALLDNSVLWNDLKENPVKENFGKATGFRVGANLVRFKYKDFIITIKGYYQSLKEEKTPFSAIKTKYSLTDNSWAAGFDFGYSIFSFLDLKIVDAQATFHSVKLKISGNSVNDKEIEYNNENTGTGYSIGSGLIIKIISDYLSLETTAGYSNVKISNLSDDKNNLFLGENKILSNGKDFIKAGGFFLSAQINIGIPIY